MGRFKRFCLVVWSLAGLFAVWAMAAAVFGGESWFRWLCVIGGSRACASLVNVPVARLAIEACLLVLVSGLVIILLRGLLSHRVDSVEVATLEGGRVTITRDAIASQAAHVVTADGTASARDVIVTNGRHGDVDVHVKVLPHNSVDVMSRGPELQARLVRELSALCGNHLDRVSVEFLEAEQPTSVVDPATPAPEPRPTSEITYVPRPDAASGPADVATAPAPSSEAEGPSEESE